MDSTSAATPPGERYYRVRAANAQVPISFGLPDTCRLAFYMSENGVTQELACSLAAESVDPRWLPKEKEGG